MASVFTGQYKSENTHGPSAIRKHNPSIRAVEDSAAAGISNAAQI
jgi:hypothetical protein